MAMAKKIRLKLKPKATSGVVIKLLFALIVIWFVTKTYPSSSRSRNVCISNESRNLNGNQLYMNSSKWIWEKLSSSERIKAMNEVMKYLQSFVSILNKTKQDKWVSQERCNIEIFGSPGGAHQLCKQETPPPNCTFLSFGISVDYSFDIDLAERWNCHGFAADPTVVHRSQLHDLVTFQNIAAKTLRKNQEEKSVKNPWWVASVPSVKKFLGLQRINVLKMDCEGCGE
jgi:hypothetical protein